jgi:hypothetical protein
VKAAEGGRRVDAEVARQCPAVALEHGQRVGGAAAATEGHHELGLGALTQRVVGGEGLEIGNDIPVVAQVEQAVVALLGGPELQLGEAAGLDAGGVDVGQLVIGGAPPPAQGRVETRGRGARVR